MSVNLEAQPRIRVLIVDDSAVMRTALARMIDGEPDLQVVATARCASDAFEKITALDPDVITLDVAMPGLDGLGTLRCIMEQFPRPVIMVSAVTEKDAQITSTLSVPELLTTSRNTCPPPRLISRIFAPISWRKFALPLIPTSRTRPPLVLVGRLSPPRSTLTHPFPPFPQSSPSEFPPAAPKLSNKSCPDSPGTFPFSSCSTCRLGLPGPLPSVSTIFHPSRYMRPRSAN